MSDPTIGELAVPYPLPTERPDGPAAFQAIAQAISKLDSVATIAALPATDNWVARTMRVRAVPGAHFWWDGAAWNMYGIGWFASTGTRDAAIPAPATNMRIYVTALASYQTYTAGAWLTEDTGWLNPSFAGAWTSVGGFPVQYRRLNGVVWMKGRPTSGTGTIFTLPTGFRPLVDFRIAGQVSGGGADSIQVTALGAVTCTASGYLTSQFLAEQ